jgi:N-acetylglucosamine-6-sulfatase
MSRAALLVAVFASSLALVAPPAAAVEPTPPPNIVMIMTDDQTLAELSVMTKTLALLGDAGTTFETNYTSFPLCCPSRATFLTGQYAFHHGVQGNVSPIGGYPALDHTNTLPVWLDDAGYRTIQLGKYLNEYDETSDPAIPPGWDDWQALTEYGYYDYTLNDNGTLVAYGSDPEDYQTDVFAGLAEDAIAEAAPGDPFFLNIGVHAPHVDFGQPAIPAPRHAGTFDGVPLPQPPSFNEADVSDKLNEIRRLPLLTSTDVDRLTERYRRSRETLLAVDDLVERVVDAVDATGELDNTVIAFTSDNGQFYGEHRIPGGKGKFFEEATHLPLLVRGPGFPAGTVVTAITGMIDLAPTFAAMAGTTPGLAVDGIDLRPLVADQAAYADRAIAMERYDGSCYTGVHTASAVYVKSLRDEEQLYDLTADPWQLDSAHDDPASATLLAALRTRHQELVPLEAQVTCAGGTARIGVGDVRAIEPNGANIEVNVPVTLSVRQKRAVEISYDIVAGSAGQRDVVLGTGTISIPAGSIRGSIPVAIKPDRLEEAAEQATVRLRDTAGALVGRRDGSITITDDPPQTSSASIGDLSVVEGDDRPVDPNLVYVPVTFSRTSATPITFRYLTTDGTAVAGNDYVAVNKTITLPAGARVLLLPLDIRADEAVEGEETFTVTINRIDGFQRPRRIGTIRIIDDESGSE